MPLVMVTQLGFTAMCGPFHVFLGSRISVLPVSLTI